MNVTHRLVPLRAVEGALLLAALLAVSGAVFIWPGSESLPLCFAPLLLVVLIAVRRSPAESLLAAMATSASALGGSYAGAGPFGGLGLERGLVEAGYVFFVMSTVALVLAERARTAKRLRESEDRLEEAQEVARLGSWELDAESDRIAWSKGVFRVFGGREEALEGSALEIIDQYVHPEDQPRCADALQSITDGRNDLCLEYRVPLAEGGLRWVLTHARAVRDRTGRLLRVVGTTQDVTERREAEEARRRSEERYRLIAENANDLIVFYSTDGTVRYASPSARSILGYAPEELVGRSGWELMTDGNDLEALRERTRRLLSGEDPQVTEIAMRRRDGSSCSVEASSRAIVDPRSGEVIEVLAVFRDVTERKRLEEELRHSHKMEAIGTLASGVAHDFNNLLTAILGWADLVLLEQPGEAKSALPEVRDGLEQITAAAERAAWLTRQLLTFARRREARPRVLLVDDLVRETEALLRRVIPESIELFLDLTPEPAHVCADPDELEQVLLNLATNARDAMPEGGTLGIRTSIAGGEGSTHGSHVVVAVEDTGTGMDTETRARIFEPFFTTKPAGEGTGLGLSTAYGIVADCGGRIDVESEPGRGSTFRIHLPIVAEAGLETTDVALPPTAPRGDERVLVCEDDVGVRNFTCRALRAAGYDVLEASDGEQALGRARENSQPIDLLLTDVVMPGIGGCELATRLGEEQPDLRLLFVSGYAAGLFDPDELRAIGDDFLEKPYDTGTLLRQVRSTLDTPHEAGRAAR